MEKMAFLFVIMMLLFSTICEGYNLKKMRCDNLQVSMCSGLPYNRTFFPNSFGHETQYEAQRYFSQFEALIKVNCFKDIKLFLCSLFFPVCPSTMYDEVVLPCRGLCKKARKGCQPIMKRYGYDWPPMLRCKNFPKNGSKTPCVHKPNDNKKGKKKGKKSKQN